MAETRIFCILGTQHEDAELLEKFERIKKLFPKRAVVEAFRDMIRKFPLKN